MAIIGSYKGVPIQAGTDAEVQAQVAAINARNLSGTGTPTPAAAGAPSPVSTPTPLPVNQPSQSLPTPSGASSSSLLAFANGLDAAVNLARKNRNASAVDLMAPYRGTVAASDFNSILNNLNTASDKTSANLIDRAIKAAGGADAGNILTVTADNGVVSGIDKTTGKIVWQTPAGTGNVQGGSGSTANTLIKSGALTYTRSDYSDDASALEQSRGADGWVDPNIYYKLYQAWVANGGKIADFVKTFPPAQYINPGADSTGQTNDWLPAYLRPKQTTTSIDSLLAS